MTNSENFTEGIDYYFDCDGLMVLTALFLEKRGFCCKQGCRHCPYPKISDAVAKAANLKTPID